MKTKNKRSAKYDENLFETNGSERHDKLVYRFDDDPDDSHYDSHDDSHNDSHYDSHDDSHRNDLDDEFNMGCFSFLNLVHLYIGSSDKSFETFTDKSMAITGTLFKFIKVMEEFSLALELFLISSNKIRSLLKAS